MIAICIGCGKAFDHIINSRGKYCSRECYRAYMRTHPPEYRRVEHIELTCDACGRTFLRRKQEVRGVMHFCSKSCAGTVTGGMARRGTQSPSQSIVCIQCGHSFSAPASANRKYCSRDCVDKHHSTAFVGTGNPNYRHGRSQVSARRIALTMFPGHCMLCGFDVFVEAHHIHVKSDGGDNRPSNLAVLCPNHHKMAQLGLIDSNFLQQAVDHALALSGTHNQIPPVEE